MNGTCRLNLEQVVRSKSRLKQKVPFNNLVLIPAQQQYGKSATYSALIPVARNRLRNAHVTDQLVQTMAE